MSHAVDGLIELLARRPLRVVAPASGVPLQTLQRLADCLGLVVSPSLVNDSTLFHANTDAYRSTDLVSALFDDRPELIIWCLRGGYGSARLLDHLSTLTPPAVEKTFIGCSDITALHVFLHQQWGWRTIHGSGLHQLLDPQHDDNFTHIIAMLNQSVREQVLPGLVPLNAAAVAVDSMHGGVMHGGNLTVLESGLGTFWQVKSQGACLFLEDVGEKGYRIDRSLHHLRQAGIFDAVRAVILGEFLGSDQDGIDVALARFAQASTFPVFKTNQFGHGALNYPIQYGARASIAHEGADVFKLVMSRV